MRWPRWATLGTCLLVLAMLAGSGWLLLTYSVGQHTVRNFVALGSVGTAIALLGLIISRKVNLVGLLFTWVGAVTMFLAARDVYYAVVVADPGKLPLDSRVVAFLDESGWWLAIAVALVLLHFPDGQVPSRRWLPVRILLVVLGFAQQGFGAVATIPFPEPLQDLPRPYGEPPLALRVLSETAFWLMILLILAAGISLFVRFRRSTGRVRAQLKWLSLAGLAAVVYPFVCLTEILVTGETGQVSTAFGIATLIALPASVAIAMLRHDLYDVDRVIADTVTYAIVMVVLLGTYAVTALTLGLFLGKGSATAAAAATAVCALVLAPLRTRLRRAVDRRLYPPRRAALLAIEDLQRRIHTEQAQPEELEKSLQTALRDPALRVGLLVPGASGFIDAKGRPVATNSGVPVMLGGVQIGLLAGASGPAVLKAVAASAASLVEVSRLRAELAGALREVEASRTRLVQAGDQERRRLERDLHDGAQQRLVSLGMAMRLAQRHLDDGTVDVNGLLDQGVAELATAIAELRQIAHGLRPTSLDDGLHAALTAITQTLPIPVQLHIGPGDLPDELATTAYFVAAEAVTNAAKYSRATSIAVRVAQSAGDVRIRVEDDGCGGATPRPGSGLSGLVDRVAAVGGSLSMNSPAGRGTTIEAVLPCGS
ncbi:sensor histidine kinase [Kribbella catacumbae]|uniref:sensor histidine kinase n=1 Tax=Kribbella catacumbae TaxID=460086 RepID=UPI0003783B45|nr:histidine kinase [Kribbella catacumbae]